MGNYCKFICQFLLFFRYGSGKMGSTAKSTPTPPLSANGPATKPKSSGKKHKMKSNSQQQEKQSNLSSPYALSLSTTPPAVTAAAKQGIPLGQSLLVVTIKDKTVKVHMPTDSAPRSPTLVECKAIIKHQQETNKRQEQEVCFGTMITKLLTCSV